MCGCVHVGMRECRGVCARITRRDACPVCVHTHKCAQECLCPCARRWRVGVPLCLCVHLCVCTHVQGWVCARALLHAHACACVHARVCARVCGHAELPAAGGAVRGGWHGTDPCPVGPPAVPLLLGAAVPHRWVWVEDTPLLPPQLFKFCFLQGNCFRFLQHGQEWCSVGRAAAPWP